MADQEGTSGPGRELWQDDLVENLMPDPSQPSNAVALVGWLGKSTRDGYRRLYFTPDLDEYVEFREEDVVQSQSLGAEQTEGSTIVWVRRDADLEHKRIVTQRAQAEFLRGDLTASFLPEARELGLTSGVAEPQWTPIIPPVIFTIVRCTPVVTPATPGITDRISQLCPRAR